MRALHILLVLLGALTLSCLESDAASASKEKWDLFQSAINAKKVDPALALHAGKTLVKEEGIWWGLHNGGRPTFYFRHLMADYPPTFTVVQQNCVVQEVTNNGHRFETNLIIVKQSDVRGRGMALTNQGGVCQSSRAAHILYYKEDMPKENPPIYTP